ncbi:diguanylate cyclase [Roseburia intestinalis]|jgi:diguanylate cyclase (GGDEF)-like protein|uniref:Diguanylate cyclase n=2 Tax=Roseburia intestinalis TaxID=166486 RepID=A0A3R6AXG6_9FIRM|nr:diguanylate cyclase [Roseburia intestinalis]RHC17873.1 diguanylate cyclase [Roseburia intestinalis]
MKVMLHKNRGTHMKNHKVEKGCILAVILFVLLCIGGSFPVNAKETGRGRVLFISSYSYAWETIPQQIEGIKKSLGDDVTIDYKFMDTKNVDTAENVHLFYKSLSYYLSQVPAYDVVIVGDDAAYNFVLVYRKIFGNTPIVFEGVNNVSKALAMDYNPNVTGIIENQTYGNTIALAKKIYPEAAHIVAIVDNTVTGLSARKEFYSYKDEFPDLEFSDINASEFSQKDLIKSVESFDESTILLYILCSNDKDGNVYASAESVQMLSSRAHIPMFSGISIGMGKGLLGGEIVSHEEMGEIAGEMALKILNGEPCENMDVITDSPMTYCFDETVMKRFGISRSMLPDDAKIINHEETFMEQYGKVIRITSVIGGIMVLFIIWLVRDNMHKRKVNETISSLNKKLNFMARYDALTSLLNRRVFMEDLQYRIREGKPFGLIMFDMDNFKRINDVYGHNEGDAVLKEMAVRAGTLVDDVFEVYRLAGDEFVAIVASGQTEVIDSYAMKILDTFKIPYQIAGGEQYLASSIGIAMYPKDGKNSTEVIAAADHAMYEVKKNGKNSRAFYDADMEEQS